MPPDERSTLLSSVLISRRRLLCAPTLLPLSARTAARTLRVGPDERWKTLFDAARAAADGDTIELTAGEYRADVALLQQRGLTLRGLGSGAVLQADGRHVEGKAIVVVRGDVTIENIEFRGCRVPSGNGAGIRFESGRLAVRRCRFFDNENGLLSGHGAEMTLDIADCEFGHAPLHQGLLHHLLYVGGIGSFSLHGSRLGGGWRGHLVKSRAARNDVRGNWLVDGAVGEASYELEFPNGGDNLVAGNLIAQGARSQNPTLVSMGAESGIGGRLRLAHNTLVNLGDEQGRFVRVWTERLGPQVAVSLLNNVFAGPGQLDLPPDWDAGGNRRVELSALRDALGGDFRSTEPDTTHAAPLPPGLAPLEFTAPLGSRAYPERAPLRPGALQSAG